MLALASGKAELADRRRRIFQQPGAVSRIGPGLGDDAGAVARSDFLLVSLDQEIERRRIDIVLLGQYRFQRAHAQFGLRQFGMIVVVMMVVVIVPGHEAKTNANRRSIPDADMLRRGLVLQQRAVTQ